MSAHHWKVRAVKSWNMIPKGLELDIIVTNRSGQPNFQEIAEALEKKYGIKLPSGMPVSSTFEFEEG